jgi:peptidoglycan/LPS O-acetylase OafA/YrhL
MKRSVLLITSAILLLTGIIFKISGIQYSVFLIALGLIILIADIIRNYFKKGKLTFRDILVISACVVLSAIIFSIVQNKTIFWILVVLIIAGLCAYLIYSIRKTVNKGEKEDN